MGKDLFSWLKVVFSKHLYLVFLSYSSGFLIFYSFYSLHDGFNTYLRDYDDFIQTLKTICILSFTAGIFTVALKYIQYLGVFQKEFNRIIDSDAFHNKLKKALSAITFSEDFLNNQSDLNDIWKKVTLSKYKREFPELYKKVEKNIRNELFEDNSLKKYYKNVQISYEIEWLQGLEVNIKEYSSFTIIRNTTDPFEWKFFVSFVRDFKSEIQNETEFLNYDKTKIGGEPIDIGKCKILNEEENERYTRKQFSYELKGKYDYHIERCFEFKQTLSEDRLLSFNSSNVVDDLSVYIKTCPNIEAIFAEVGRNKFYANGIFDGERQSYINRDVFLPGEKYKIFLYKK